MRPSRREGPAILPSLRSHEADILAVLDTSGSIADGEMRDFLAEINAIKGQLHARVTLLACDTALAEGCPWVFEPWETLALPASIQGGGGTDFRPAFQWIERQDLHPGVVVYFTDAQGEFPKLAPQCPVVWLVKGHAPVPWGNRVQLN
jgi:predicted metal-dependent peptidase